MRPLSVLILVLGAVAALVFAIVSITGDRGQHGTVVNRDLVVNAAEDEPGSAELAAPREIVDPAGPLPTAAERAEVQTDASVRGAYLGGIRGIVVDQSETPVADAKVFLLNVQTSETIEAVRLVNDQDPPKPKQSLVTDQTGTFTFGSLEPGEWTIVVTHDLYVRYEANGIVVPEDGIVDEKIVLEPGLGVHGYVYDARTGVGIEGAQLVLDNSLAAFLPSTRRSATRKEATTDARGYFTFPNAGDGSQTLIITAKGYATEVHNNFLLSWGADEEGDDPGQAGPAQFRRNMSKVRREEATRPKEKTFELEPGKRIAGRVVGPNREGIPGVSVEAINQTGAVGSRGTAVSVSGGEFLIEDVAEGFYTLRAQAKGFSSQPLQRVETGSTDVEIVLAEMGSVSGHVLIAATGKPATSFTVKIRAMHPQNPSWGNTVANGSFHDRSNGSFTLSGIRQGEYVAEAAARGFASSFSEPFVVAEGKETTDVVVRLTRGGTLKGVVIDSYSGEPIPGAEVSTRENNYVDTELFELLDALSDSASTKASVRTAEDGSFQLELMTPDVYQIGIEKAGYSTMTLNNVNIGDGSVTDMGVQKLSKGATVSGKVYGPDGLPAPGATVYMSPTDNDPWGSRQARTDANGTYVIKNAFAGTYKLHASRPTGGRGNPFAAVVDMRNSEIEISVNDGQEYEFDLHMASTRPQSQ